MVDGRCYRTYITLFSNVVSRLNFTMAPIRAAVLGIGFSATVFHIPFIVSSLFPNLSPFS